MTQANKKKNKSISLKKDEKKNLNVEQIQSFFSHIVSPKDYDHKIKEMKSSKMFQKLNIPDSTYEKNVFDFWKIYQDNLKCKNSQSKDCTNSNGYHLWPSLLKNNQIIINEIICPKQSKKLKENKYINHYEWKTFDSNLLYSFINEQNINKKWDPSRIELLKYMEKIQKEIFDKNVKGFYLYGKSGVGKSYLTILFCNTIAKNASLLNKKFSICYLNLLDLINTLTNKFAEQLSIENDIKKLSETDLLVLDDIGSETPKDWFFNNHLTKILNARNDNKKLTIFVSNYSLAELNKYYLRPKYGIDKKAVERVLSRIHSLIGENIFELKGNDFRKKIL